MQTNIQTDINTADFWQARYDEGSTEWDMGMVSPPIKAYIDERLLTNEKSLKILIAGAGNAYEAEYLHNLGFSNVYVVDFAQTPLDNLLNKVPDFPKEHLLQADFFSLTDETFGLAGFFDLAIEQTFFCAITPDIRASYVHQMHKLLKPQGNIVGLLWNCHFPHEQSTSSQIQPPFGGSEDEYQQLFSSLFDIQVMKVCTNSHPARQNRELFVEFQKV